MTDQMIPLLTQSQFEDLLKPNRPDGKPASEAVVVYFTAPWCGACKKLDFKVLLESTPKTIVWYKCDVDVNKYTLGYCGLTKIPSFTIIKNGKFLGKFTTSDTMTVFDTLKDAFD
jgi:thioredoxin-like negative regulator of GroEL